MLLAQDFIRCYLKRPAWEPWEGTQKLLNQVEKWTGKRGETYRVPSHSNSGTGSATWQPLAFSTLLGLEGGRGGEGSGEEQSPTKVPGSVPLPKLDILEEKKKITNLES